MCLNETGALFPRMGGGRLPEDSGLGNRLQEECGLALRIRIGVSYCGNGFWEFWYDIPEEVMGVFDAACGVLEKGQSVAARRVFRRILRHYPFFTDCLNMLGAVSMKRHRYRKALQYYEESVKISAKAMPYGFFGKLPWGILSNRPFWRGIQGSLGCLVEIGMTEEARKLASWASQFYCQDWGPMTQFVEDLGLEAR
jgi:hypothetical protein